MIISKIGYYNVKKNIKIYNIPTPDNNRTFSLA